MKKQTISPNLAPPPPTPQTPLPLWLSPPQSPLFVSNYTKPGETTSLVNFILFKSPLPPLKRSPFLALFAVSSLVFAAMDTASYFPLTYAG